MIVAKYGNVELNVYDNYSINKSGNEVSFSDISCDFTGHSKDDLPEKYQEIKVIDTSLNKVRFVGYLDSYDLGEMRETDIERDVNISLLSPLSLATLRTVSVVGTYEIKELINEIFRPLVDDGFVIKEINLSNRNVTANYVLETIEYCMNDLSSSFNLWWFIDENKNIYVKDIDIMLNLLPELSYNDEDSIPGLEYLKPKISSGDYSNVVNLKNARIYEYSKMSFDGKDILENTNGLVNEQISSLKANQSLTFNYSVAISLENLKKSFESNGITGQYVYSIHCKGKFTDNSTFEFYYRYNRLNGEYLMSDNLQLSTTNATKDFSLTKDSFFDGLITGFVYNGSKEIKELTQLDSDSILLDGAVKVYNDKAIAEKKDIISKTGIIESTVDLNNQWLTIQEAKDIGVSYIAKNLTEFDGEVEAKTDEDVFKVGQVVSINKMFFDSKYVVTSIKEEFQNNSIEYIATLSNAKNVENFIDVFRGKQTQQSESGIANLLVAHYYDEEIKEIHEVVE